MSGGVTLSAPTVYPARKTGHVLNGETIGGWITDFSFSAEDDTEDFEGQQGLPTAVIPTGTTMTVSFTIADHPTPMAILEALKHDLNPDGSQQTGTHVRTKPDGRTHTYVYTVSSLEENASNGVAEVEVECNVVSFSRS